ELLGGLTLNTPYQFLIEVSLLVAQDFVQVPDSQTATSVFYVKIDEVFVRRLNQRVKKIIEHLVVERGMAARVEICMIEFCLVFDNQRPEPQRRLSEEKSINSR